jgi:hypothetical protein
LSATTEVIQKALDRKNRLIPKSKKFIEKALKPIPTEEFKTCEYCYYYKGTHCEKHIKRNRVFERCQYYSFEKNRGKPILPFRQ